MRADGIKDIKIYIYRHHNTEAQYVTTHPILDLCLDVKRRPESWVLKWWWENEDVLFSGRQVGEEGGARDGGGDGSGGG